MSFYDSTIEAQMQRLFAGLSEKDKHRYAGIEVCKLGHGGIDYISTLFDIDPKTIRRGQEELNSDDALAGGGGLFLLILCDGGGSNASNRYVFKEALQKQANRLGLEIRIAHYPPYCSKHNPIEHRLFPHITKACQGVVFHSVAIAKFFMEKAKNNTGLKVSVDVLTGIYATGKKCAENFIETMPIVFDDFLPKWNYCALPQQN